MLTRLKHFDSVGQFESATTNVPLAKMALIYAENGRGKTTLAAILRSLASGDVGSVAERHRLAATNPPHIVIEGASPPAAVFQNGAWNRTIPDVVVFDDTFVDANVCSGLAVDSVHRQNLHELILGAQGVALNNALLQFADDIDTHNRELRTKADAIPINIRGGLTSEKFCALPARSDIEDAIQEAERALAAANQQEAIRAAQEFAPFGLPSIDLAGVTTLLARDLPELDRAAAAHVQAHVANLGQNGEAWVASGVDRISEGADTLEGKPCPFCAQDLAGATIIAHYRAYFGDAYTGLKRDVVAAVDAFNAQHAGDTPLAFERSIRAASERQQFWARFADIPVLELQTIDIGATWATARDAVYTALLNKQHTPLEPLQLSNAALAAVEAYEAVRAAVDAESNRLQQANVEVRLVKERAAVGNVALLEADLAILKATKDRHSAPVAPLCTVYLAEKAAKTATEQRREAARAALDQYRTTVFPAYQTKINDYLQKFNAGFRLDQITSQNIRAGSAATYNVMINNRPVAVAGGTPPAGQPSFRTSLSAGDRNTLALAFFFASLDQDPSLATKIVVIDDPVSSLDDHRTLTTVQELRRLMRRTAQVIVLSHSKPFLCNIWDQTDPTLRGALELVRDGLGSAIRAWDVNRDMITEHDRRHELLRNYEAAATPNNREVAHSIRPVLEAFLRVAYPASYTPGMMLGQFRGLCQQRVGTAQEIIDQTDIDELRDLTDYGNLFHHDTNPAWQAQQINDTELLGYVRRTLAFAQR